MVQRANYLQAALTVKKQLASRDTGGASGRVSWKFQGVPESSLVTFGVLGAGTLPSVVGAGGLNAAKVGILPGLIIIGIGWQKPGARCGVAGDAKPRGGESGVAGDAKPRPGASGACGPE